MTTICKACGKLEGHWPNCPSLVNPPLAVPPKAPVPTSPLATQVAGSHYKDLKIQPLEYIHANGIPFAEGCVIKYVSRWRNKGGIKDLEKAKHFLELLIELETRA